MKIKTQIKGTVQAWSDSLGIDPHTLKKKLNRADIKFEVGKPLDAIDVFRALTAEYDKDQAMTRKLNAETKKTERENAVAEGRLHDVAAVEKMIWQELLAPLRAEMLAMPRTLAPRCASVEESQEVLTSWVDGTLQKLGREKK